MANSWSGVQGMWKEDGSEGASLVVNGEKLSVSSTKRGTPFNVYLELALVASSNVDGYLEVTIAKSSSSLSLGVVAPEQCKPGWKTRGMFYNGNLTNGAAALKTAFGPYLKEKNRVGVRYSRDNKSLSVIFYYNGRCLGKGFELKSEDVKFAIFYPCLHVDGAAEVSVTVPFNLPASVLREDPQYDDPFEGEYRLIEATDESKEAGKIELETLEHPVLWNIAKEGGQLYRLSIKAGNNMRTRITATDTSVPNQLRVQIPPPMSTLMLPPQDLQAVETFLSAALPLFNVMELHDDGSISLRGESVEAVCEPYYVPEVTLTKYYDTK